MLVQSEVPTRELQRLMLKFVWLFPLPPEGFQEAAPQGSGSFALPGDLLVYSWWLVAT